MSEKILIVGGVAGGASAAARLRRINENAEIIMFEKGEYISFANCGLPYYIGDVIKEKSKLTLQTPQSFKSRFNIDVRVFSEVVAIHKDSKKVSVKNLNSGEIYEEYYDKLILSPGSEPIRPSFFDFNNEKVFTLRNIPDTYKIKEYINDNKPRKSVIVGGGFIGVEVAENLAHMGISVTLIEMQDQVLAPIDKEMASQVHRKMNEHGINLMLGTTLLSINNNGESLDILTDKCEFDVDMVIMAIGVKPDSVIADEAGLEIGLRGHIIVNDRMQTSDENIFAVGDAIEIVDFVTKQKSAVPLAGPANKQGRIAADNIFGENKIYNGTQGTSIIKVFDLTVASTGINEKTAKRAKIDYEKVYLYPASHAGYYPNAENMNIKALYDPNNGKILGAQIVGYSGVDKRIDVIATAIRFGAKAKDLAELELAYAPPFSSAKDPVNMIGFMIENILTGRVKNFYFDQIEELMKDDNNDFIDIRTESEFAKGSISGFRNIPLDSLRDRINEIDKNKKIYVTCQVGLRGYVGSRILKQNGFDVYNLTGGYSFFKTALYETNSLFNKICDDEKANCEGKIIK